MLTKLKDTFKDSSVGKFALPAIAAFGIATMPMTAHAEAQCAPLYVSEQGLTRGASFSAHEFSTRQQSNVGIAIYAGQEFNRDAYIAKNITPEKIGTYLVKQLEAEGNINAECFIHYSEMPKGTSITYIVDGTNIPRQDHGLQLGAALDKNIINTVKGTANLIKAGVLARNMEQTSPNNTLAANIP